MRKEHDDKKGQKSGTGRNDWRSEQQRKRNGIAEHRPDRRNISGNAGGGFTGIDRFSRYAHPFWLEQRKICACGRSGYDGKPAAFCRDTERTAGRGAGYRAALSGGHDCDGQTGNEITGFGYQSLNRGHFQSEARFFFGWNGVFDRTGHSFGSGAGSAGWNGKRSDAAYPERRVCQIYGMFSENRRNHQQTGRGKQWPESADWPDCYQYSAYFPAETASARRRSSAGAVRNADGHSCKWSGDNADKEPDGRAG